MVLELYIKPGAQSSAGRALYFSVLYGTVGIQFCTSKLITGTGMKHDAGISLLVFCALLSRVKHCDTAFIGLYLPVIA